MKCSVNKCARTLSLKTKLACCLKVSIVLIYFSLVKTPVDPGCKEN